jgi:transposase
VLREQLREPATDRQLARCARLRTSPSHDLERRATVIALRAAARRALALQAEARELEAEITKLVAELAPDLLAEVGVGPISAAQILLSSSHHHRLRDESAFASHSGTSPIPASSGQTIRHRLNRSGDRKLNRALHVIVLTRSAHHPETRTYIQRRTAEGKTPRNPALPQALHRPPPLPPTPNQRQPRTHQRHLTAIEASDPDGVSLSGSRF